ncbi:Ldh family oxidoreductase [Achromobacter sp. JUb104]|uniref:Ldh family oxidoreductase n=1 Tax=Achromobacter sp. JUb104 TaxID=2940590 RepID=UPI00216A413F|nr:Ldh family oxidoreductase [Achromobacter sp. JUb104]MCS3509315.1 LDH2 family malate/lactate/ureidoglycolate dehydrogenase [Achromobacter sp. JUb104]
MTTVHASVGRLIAAATSLLVQAGASDATASLVALQLIKNDLDGYPSHGLQRLPDYLADIKKGFLDPTATPRASRTGRTELTIDAGRTFGALVVPAITEGLREIVSEHGAGIVLLRNSHHLGRLSSIGFSASAHASPYVLIGFCNFAGCGARVAYPGTSSATLCTNPLLISIPIPGEDPFVLDMSTTTVAEGKVRAAVNADLPIPTGWLIDRDGNSVTDPTALYADENKATMTPLGWPSAAHKGFHLGLAAEMLVGAYAGAGNIHNPSSPGNGALFVGFQTSIGQRSGGAENAVSIVAAATGGARYPGSTAGTTASVEEIRRSCSGNVQITESLERFLDSAVNYGALSKGSSQGVRRA